MSESSIRKLILKRPGPQGPQGAAGETGPIAPSSITQGGAALNDVLRWNGTNWVPAAVAGGGTVTQVDISGGTTGLTFSGGPITGSGTFTAAGTLAVANGGTGAATAANARTALGLGTADEPQFAGIRLSYEGDIWALRIIGLAAGFPVTQWVKQ